MSLSWGRGEFPMLIKVQLSLKINLQCLLSGKRMKGRTGRKKNRNGHRQERSEESGEQRHK